MAAQKGNKLTILRGDGASPEVFTLLAGVRAKTIRVNNEPIDVTTDDDVSAGVSWRTFITGVVDFQSDISGVVKDEATFKLLLAESLAGTVVNYQADLNGVGVFEGPMIFANIELTGNHDGAVEFNAQLRANSALTFTADP